MGVFTRQDCPRLGQATHMPSEKTRPSRPVLIASFEYSPNGVYCIRVMRRFVSGISSAPLLKHSELAISQTIIDSSPLPLTNRWGYWFPRRWEKVGKVKGNKGRSLSKLLAGLVHRLVRAFLCMTNPITHYQRIQYWFGIVREVNGVEGRIKSNVVTVL